MSIRLWAVGRRIQYGLGFSTFWILIGALVYFTSYYAPPNCFDGEKNGEESGIDCGGACVLLCAADIIPPRIVWAEEFEVSPGQYNALAYVENPNQTVGTPQIEYTFSFYDDDELVGERSGVTVLPSNSVYPIFEGRVFVPEGVSINRTELVLGSAQVWLPSSLDRGQFSTIDINLMSSDTKPRLEVDIQNNAVRSAEDIEVVATIFNDKGVPVTASQTVIEFISSGEKQKIAFTWPNPIAKTIKNCIIPTDISLAIDLSGSMNNDGLNPPQPLTRTLEAAANFARSLKTDDQLALVTFATNAVVVNNLKPSSQSMVETILNLDIDPAEETGFTNTFDALSLASAELESTRHNDNARRVLVLLTDGLPTTSGDEDVVGATEQYAKFLHSSGLEIYAIGLGNNVDKNFINAIASDNLHAYFAPTGDELASIYTEITTSLCEVGPTKIDIIAKPKPSFAPLQ